MNAEDLAAGRWKPIKQAREKIAKSESVLTASHDRLEKLRREIPAAEGRDRKALGAALVEGTSEPEPEAEQLRAELVAEERRNEALAAAVDWARAGIRRQVEQHRRSWHRDALGELGRAEKSYLATINDLETARQALSDAASLCVWISGGGAPVTEAATEVLSGRLGDASGRSGMGFSAVLAELRADAAHLTAYPAGFDEPAPHPAWQLIRRAAS